MLTLVPVFCAADSCRRKLLEVTTGATGEVRHRCKRCGTMNTIVLDSARSAIV